MWFKEGVRIIQLLHRKKDGGAPFKEEKFLSLSSDEFDDVLEWAIERQQQIQSPSRIYVTVNARSLEKAKEIFSLKLVEDALNGKMDNFINMDAKFLTVLHSSKCKKDSLVLHDVDSDEGESADELVSYLQMLKVDIVDMIKTPNGWHIITKPYSHPQPPKLNSMWHPKKNASFLLDPESLRSNS